MNLVISQYKLILSSLTAFFFFNTIVNAQPLSIKEYVVMTNNLDDSSSKAIFMKEISKSQFVLVGEEHGYKENSEITNLLFRLSQLFGFKYLCIETDSIAADLMEKCARDENPISSARKLYESYPFSIPFYNSPDDYQLFKNVVSNGGKLWGIDQSFMTQFRLNFSQLNKFSSNTPLKQELTKLEKKAHASFRRAIENSDFRAPFIFQYSDSLHNGLLNLCRSSEEKKVLEWLRKSTEIYSYTFNNQQYLNNLHRSYLMKSNFLSYYLNSQILESTPKVVFKLGANHSGRGLNNSKVFDVSNLLSELAIVNGMSSTHILLRGLKGEKANANPFSDASTSSYDNRSQIPKEIVELMKDSGFKYFIINLKQLRDKAENCSDKLSELMFRFDITIFIDNTIANNTF